MNERRKKRNEYCEIHIQEERFSMLCEAWLLKKRSKLKASSYAKYEYVIKNYLIPNYGGILLREADISDFENGLLQIYNRKLNNHISNSLMKTIIYLINAILAYGYQKKLCQSLKVEFEFPSNNIDEVRYLKDEETIALLKYLLRNTDDNSKGTLLALLTGMRLGEVCSLQKKNLDLDLKVIYVKTTVQRLKINGSQKTALVVSAPKSRRSYRVIPIPDILMEYLLYCEIFSLSDEQYVLGCTNKPYDPRTLQYGFSKILKNCGLDHINYHALRHTFASKCVHSGFDIQTLSEILGHTSVSFTLNKYVHTDIKYKRKQMDLFNNDLDKAI